MTCSDRGTGADLLNTVDDIRDLVRPGLMGKRFERGGQRTAMAAQLFGTDLETNLLIKLNKERERGTYYRWLTDLIRGRETRIIYSGGFNEMSEAESLAVP